MAGRKAGRTERADDALDTQEIDTSIADLQKLLAKNPKDIRSLTKIGDLHLKKGDKVEAIRVHRQAAEFHAEQGFYPKAVSIYLNIAEYAPENVAARTRLAEMYAITGQNKECIGQWRELARIHASGRDLDQARSALEQVIRLAPDDAAAKIQIALSYEHEGRATEAAEKFAEAAAATENALTPEGREVYLYAAERAIRLDPTRVELALALSKRLLALKDTARALHMLKLCYLVQPEHPELLAGLGSTFQALKEKDKAVLVTQQLIGVLERTGHAEYASKLRALIQ